MRSKMQVFIQPRRGFAHLTILSRNSGTLSPRTDSKYLRGSVRRSPKLLCSDCSWYWWPSVICLSDMFRQKSFELYDQSRSSLQRFSPPFLLDLVTHWHCGAWFTLIAVSNSTGMSGSPGVGLAWPRPLKASSIEPLELVKAGAYSTSLASVAAAASLSAPVAMDHNQNMLTLSRSVIEFLVFVSKNDATVTKGAL